MRDTYYEASRDAPDLAKAWQEEFIKDGGGSFPKRSPASIFAQKHRREPFSAASTACPTPRSVTPNDLHSQWVEVSAQQSRPMSARPQSAGGRRAQADMFEHRLAIPRPTSARFAEERTARRDAVEFHAKSLGREYRGEGWLQRIERRVEKASTPVTVVNSQAHMPPRNFGGGPKSPAKQCTSKERDEGMHSSDMIPDSPSRQEAGLRKHTPRSMFLKTGRGKKQMGSGRKAKLVDNDKFGDMTEAILHVQTAERHIVERKKEESVTRQLSVLHPANPRYPDLAAEPSQTGVEWTLTDERSMSVDESSQHEPHEYRQLRQADSQRESSQP